VTRLGVPPAPGAPDAPDAPFIVESLDIPVIDREQLEQELEALHEQLDDLDVEVREQQERIIVEAIGERDGEALFYEFETLSQMGDTALAGTEIWFGMPLTRGLKFAELDAGLSTYFGTDRGVLVLQAREGNVLQLLSGDVIQAVDGTEVRRPADVMRALRGVDPGESVDLSIMRRQAPETLTVEIPENRLGLRFDADAPAFAGWRFRLGGNEAVVGLRPAPGAAPEPRSEPETETEP
jgi:hypothetical protein